MSSPESPSPQWRQEEVLARGERIPVTVVEPADPRGDLLFLHGYGRDPRDYRGLLERLAARGHRIVAPFIFANGALERPPTTFWACAALARRAAEALLADGRLSAGSPAVGHSTGGAVTLTFGGGALAPSALVAVNPVQPSSAPSPLFMLRSAWMNTKMALGLAGDGAAAREVLSDSAGRFYANWLRSPLRNFQLIGGLRSFDYDRLARWAARRPRFEGPVTVLYGHGDEFYPSCDGIAAGLSRVFPAFALAECPEENSHEWLMFRPETAAERIQGALGA